jgi:PBP4 family serine-type D-alanyl-D-alanine carboxypeptidase
MRSQPTFLTLPRRGSLLLALGLCLGIPARADQAELAARIDAALLRLGRYTTAAVRVYSLDTKEVLYERNADLSLNPASNMKLLTSATAFAKLGPEYRFTTRVLAAAKPGADGVLHGDLVLQGGGDPTLETADLEKLAEAVRAAGIRRVEGGLVADDFRFSTDRLGNGWNWDDEPFYYSAQVSALSVNRNVLYVDVRPGKAGEPPVVQVRPIEGVLQIESHPLTGAAGTPTRLNVQRQRARNGVRVDGSIAEDAEPVLNRLVSVEEPQLYAAALFRKLLSERGVEVTAPTRHAQLSAPVEIAAHQSGPLSEIMAKLNKPSDNLFAELLLRELGKQVKGKGDWETGSEVVEGWLKEIGVDAGGVRVNDGSGLSRLDLVTARALSDMLIHIQTQPWKDAFVASLPVAGVDGTLRARLQGTKAASNVRAKTGTLLHVSGLSGYASGAAGERLVFSILVNHHAGALSAKRVEDMIAVALAEYDAKTAAP